MKTTLDLPDDLLVAAKTAAARRRTTLRAIVESALRRELRPAGDTANPNPDRFERHELGYLVIKPQPSDQPITAATIRTLQDEGDDEEVARALRGSAP